MTRPLLVFCLLVLLAPGASGAIINMEADGSGDYQNLLQAAIALADGDTLILGAGRFETINVFIDGYCRRDAVVVLMNDNITVLGQGPGNTIVGPASGGSPASDADGISLTCSVEGLTLSGLTIEHLDDGVDAYGEIRIDNCEFINCDIGADIHPSVGHIQNCSFDTGRAGMWVVGGGGDSFQVSDCTISGFEYGISAASLYLSVSNVDIVQCTNAVWAMGGVGESVSLNGVNISGCDTGVAAHHMSGPTLHMQDCSVVAENHALDFNAESEVLVLDTILESLNGITILAGHDSEISINASHILAPEGMLRISLSGYHDVEELDLSGNFWGGVGAPQMPDLIHDHLDDPGLSATVIYMPMADGPLAVDQVKWGQLKASYR